MVLVVEYVPALHFMHDVVTLEVYEPGPQDIHCDDDVSPGVLEYDPDGQYKQ